MGASRREETGVVPPAMPPSPARHSGSVVSGQHPEKPVQSITKKICKEVLERAKEIWSEFKEMEVEVLHEEFPGHRLRKQIVPLTFYQDRMQVYDKNVGTTTVVKYSAIKGARCFQPRSSAAAGTAGQRSRSGQERHERALRSIACAGLPAGINGFSSSDAGSTEFHMSPLSFYFM